MENYNNFMNEETWGTMEDNWNAEEEEMNERQWEGHEPEDLDEYGY